MRKRLLAIVSVVLLSLGAATAAPAGDGHGKGHGQGKGQERAKAHGTLCVLKAELSPANEVRTDTTDPVQSTATGKAHVRVLPNGSFTYKVKIRNAARETFVAGHIHRGGAGVNGPVLVALFGGADSSEHVKVRGTATLAGVTAEQLCGNPSGFYVNFHTTQDPQGATRGQLH